MLAAFTTQSFGVEQFEVVVVSDGSTDGTDDYLGDVQMPFDLVFASQANAGPAAARNHAARLARGDLLLFVDDDVVAASDLIEQHVQTHDHHGAHVVVIGPMLTPSDYRPGVLVQWEQAMLYKQYEAMKRGDYAPTYRQFHTGNASVDRRFFLDAGGFDERFRRAEDVEFAYRLSVGGARFVFNPSAVGNHYAERSFSSWIGIARDYGRNDVVFDREAHPGALDTARREFRRSAPADPVADPRLRRSPLVGVLPALARARRGRRRRPARVARCQPIRARAACTTPPTTAAWPRSSVAGGRSGTSSTPRRRSTPTLSRLPPEPAHPEPASS